MAVAARNLELLKKYGISSNPLPFDGDDVVSETTDAAQESMKTMVVTEPTAKKIVIQLKPPAQKVVKVATVIKPKRQYTKKTKGGENDVNLSDVPVKSLNLKLSPPPVYTEFFAALFPTAMEAASFSANYDNATTEMDGFNHAVLVPLVDREDMVVVGALIKKAKAASATTYHIHSKTVKAS